MHILKKLTPSKTNIIVFLSFYFISIFIVISILRIGYHYELQWMEGSIFENVSRVIQGKPIYTAPSMEFVSYLYMPLYYYITALLSKVIGLGFYTLRLVSFLSALGSLILIYLFIIKETKNKIAAFAGIGLFCASYNICSGYFDVGRIDMLFVFFLLGGMFALRFYNSIPATLISSLSFILAFFTKQTALILVIVLLVYMFLFKRKYRLQFTFIFLIISITGCIILNNYSDGWFYYYVFRLSSKHILDLRGFLVFMGLSTLFFIPIISIRLLFNTNSEKAFFYSSLIASTGALTVSALINPLFDLNLFIPMAAVMSMIFGVCFNAINNIGNKNIILKNKRTLWSNRKLVNILIIAQFVIFFYNPLKYIPTPNDSIAGNLLEQKISDLQGTVYIPSHPYICNNLGMKKYTHILPLHDMLELNRDTEKTKIEKDIKLIFLVAIRKQYFDFIILDNVNRLGFLQPEIDKYYHLKESIFNNKTVFWTFSGAKRRPEYIYAKN